MIMIINRNEYSTENQTHSLSVMAEFQELMLCIRIYRNEKEKRYSIHIVPFLLSNENDPVYSFVIGILHERIEAAFRGEFDLSLSMTRVIGRALTLETGVNEDIYSVEGRLIAVT